MGHQLLQRVGVMLLSAAMALALTSAFAQGQSSSSATFTPEGQQKYDARTAPAKATVADENEMISKGFIRIGTVRATLPKKKSNSALIEQLETVILQKAADAGGDYVCFSKEGEHEKIDVTKTKYKHGPCEQFGTRAVSTTSASTSCYTDVHGFAHCMTWNTPGMSSVTTCVKYGEGTSIPYTKKETSLVSEGTVWRYESRQKLFEAVGARKVEDVRSALAAGAKVNEVDSRGFTALHYAIAMKQPDVVSVLVANGADLNAAVTQSGDYEGMTPLMMAAVWQPAMVELFLERGANVDATAKNGYTALAFAIYEWNVDAVKALAAHGANLNWQDENGDTYLMLAAQRVHAETVKALLDLGADKTLRNKQGQSAKDIAIDTMSGMEKVDAFAKGPALRWQCMISISLLANDKERQAVLINAAQEWLAHAPNDAAAYLWLGRSYLNEPANYRKAADNYELVLRNLQGAESSEFLKREARMLLPQCYEKVEMWEDVVYSHEAAVREFPQDGEILNSAAWFYATTKSKFRSPAKALDYATRAVAASPNDPNIVDTLAEAYFVNGRINDAVATEEKAVALAPDRKDIQQDMDKYKRAQRASQMKKSKPAK